MSWVRTPPFQQARIILVNAALAQRKRNRLLICGLWVQIPQAVPCGIGVMVAYGPSKPLVRVRISYAAPCLVRLMVRTQPSQGCNTSSTLVRDTIFLIIEYCECEIDVIGRRAKLDKFEHLGWKTPL